MECFAQIQNTHLNLGREFGGVAEKLRHGVGEQCGLQTSEAEGRVGSPVDRHRQARTEEPERLGGAERIEVPGPTEGPQPQIGTSATSRPAESVAIPSKRSVSPAK